MVIDFETYDAIENEAVRKEEELLLKNNYELLGNRRVWSKSKIKENQLPLHIIKCPFIYQIFHRVHYEDRNLLGIIVGETGAGKSCSAIQIAKMIDVTPLGNHEYKENFVIRSKPNGDPAPECRVVFRASDFLRLVRSNLPKGSVIIWDEAGIGNDNNTWYEKKSQIVKHVLQSFRSKNLVLLMTVPDEESVTIGTRRLIHLMIDVEARNDNYAKGSVQWYQRNRKTKKVYKKTTAFDDENGQPLKVNKILIPKLDKKTEDEYNKIKTHVLDDINSFYEKEMAAMEKIERDKIDKKINPNENVKFDLMKGLDLVKQNKDYCWNPEKLKYDPNKIVYILQKNNIDCSSANARVISANLD
jgi:ABC-type dipeptide/oligopeptide/nickel transport system ATPase component